MQHILGSAYKFSRNRVHTLTRRLIGPTRELELWRKAQREDPVLREVLKRVGGKYRSRTIQTQFLSVIGPTELRDMPADGTGHPRTTN